MQKLHYRILTGIIGVLLVALACWLSMTVSTGSLEAASYWFGQPDDVTGDKSWAIQNRVWVYASIVLGRLLTALIIASLGTVLLASSIRSASN